jgi:uncharacterized protein (DUF1800 family)
MTTRALFWQAAAILVIALGGFQTLTSAQQLSMDQLTKNVWKRTFNISDAQANDPVWLAKDDDGDGISNGAELVAGTDPASRGSTLAIANTTLAGTVVHVSFLTEKGKEYTLQQSTDLTNPNAWTTVAPPGPVTGTGDPLTLDGQYAPNRFFRVLVQEVDHDGDGISDWAEAKLGLDPNNAQSNGNTDAYGRPLNDNEYASNNFNGENIVTVSASGSNASATQPDAGQTASDLGAFTITRAGLPTVLGTITVNLSLQGTAVAGTDYATIASTVIMAAGQRTVTVPVTPLANASRRAPVTVALTVLAGPGYTVGSGSVAGVTILPYETNSGTGLTGAYYSNASATYGSATNFAATNLVTTRLDSTVDFKWSASLPTGVLASSFCIRWTGQIQPQYSETYFFDVYAREGCVLKVGGQTVINNWASLGSLTDMIGSITLQAGVRYDIQLDYFSNDGTSVSETHLKWYSDSLPKVVVPTARLYPSASDATAAPPTITSPATAFAFLGQPFSFDITTSSGSATTITLASGSLPAGLTFTATTVNGNNVGRISGTPTQAGDFPLVAMASNSAGGSSSVLDLQVLDSGNGITKEVWTGLSATATVADIPVSTTPNITGVLSSFEDTATNYGNNFGERIRGYVTVPATGMYYFWIAGSDAAELWISTDSEPCNKVKRCSSTGATSRQWSAQTKQKSGWLQLNAGAKYYVEVLHKGLDGSANNLAVGYKLDATGSGTALVNGTGVVPGYMIWKYYPAPLVLAPANGQDNLYFTRMAPQGTAVSTGSGLATLQLNAAETQATLRFSYAGLTTAVTGAHLHNDQFLTHPSQIIFDIDEAEPNEDGSLTWTFGAVGTFTSAAQLVQVIREGKCYINIHTVNYPGGEIRGNFTIANGAQAFVPPVHPSPGFTLPGAPTDAEASRFLTQATFGPNPSDIAAVKSSGFPSWITTQFNLTASHMFDNVFDTKDVNNRYPDEQIYNGFWRLAVTAPDQLRQRVAFALSQIMVTSAIGTLDNNSRALGSYYDVLLDNAFANYRTLLKNVTLHPAMGRYLDMLGNRNGDISTGRIPNENYAREIQQLFSIGLNRLWPDGTLVLDSKFAPVPTYDQSVILGFARVFTGWNYYQPRNASTGRLPTNFGSYNDTTGWIQPMQLFPANGTGSTSSAYHELGTKKLLDNVFLPAATVTAPNNTVLDTDPTSPYYNYNLYDRNGLKDLDDAIDSIFNHRNVGPFICRQLIQRLVTSSPTPGYVYRVVQAFNGEKTWDGQVTGVRGDMKEVIKAILLDYEARSTDMLLDPTFGKQREPVLRVTAPARYFLSKPVSGSFTQSSGYAAGTNPYPHRIRLDITGDLLVGSGEFIALKFKSLTSGTLLPVTTYNTSTYYYTRTAPTFPNGASPRTNPTIYVDAFGVQGGNYFLGGPLITVTANSTTDAFTSTAHGLVDDDQIWVSSTSSVPSPLVAGTIYFVRNSTANTFQVATAAGGTAINLTNTGSGTISVLKSIGTTITVNSIASVQNNSAHSLAVGRSVYLRFFGPGAPADGIYTVVTAPTTTQFTVTAAASGSAFNSPAAFTRQANCSYSPNSDHSIINMYSPVPHGLAVGQEVYIVDNAGTALPITGRYDVKTIPLGTDGLPDPYRFTVNASGTGSSTLAISNVTILPLIPPVLDRTGTLDFYNSTWLLNQTDSESTTASLSQTPMRSSTVFNFYSPDYAYPGNLALNGVTTPEFQLTSDTNTMLLTNFLEQGIQQSGFTDGRTSFRSGSGAIVLDMSALMTATDTSNANLGANIIDKLNRELMGGTMSTSMRNAIEAYVANNANFPYTTPTPTTTQMRNRIRAIVHLIITSTEFAIQR